jgi:hypothetical protein
MVVKEEGGLGRLEKLEAWTNLEGRRPLDRDRPTLEMTTSPAAVFMPGIFRP